MLFYLGILVQLYAISSIYSFYIRLLFPSESLQTFYLSIPGFRLEQIFLFIICIYINAYLHEYAHAYFARLYRVPIVEISLPFHSHVISSSSELLPINKKKEKKNDFWETIYQMLFFYVDLDAKKLKRIRPDQRMNIIFAGPFVNLLLALFGFLIFSLFTFPQPDSFYVSKSEIPGINRGDYIWKMEWFGQVLKEEIWQYPDLLQSSIRDYEPSGICSLNHINDHDSCPNDQKCFQSLNNQQQCFDLNLLFQSATCQDDSECPQNQACFYSRFLSVKPTLRLYKVNFYSFKNQTNLTLVHLSEPKSIHKELYLEPQDQNAFISTPLLITIIKSIETFMSISFSLGMLNMYPAHTLDGGAFFMEWFPFYPELMIHFLTLFGLFHLLLQLFLFL